MDIKSFITLAPGVEIETLVEEPVGRTGINVRNFFFFVTGVPGK
jgi:hypothetical protein